jgi:hypothetical protein
MWIRLISIILLPLLLTACAINDVPGASTPDTGINPASPASALIIGPPGELKLAGDCNITDQLEDWLQVTLPAREQFEAKLKEAVVKSPSEIYDDVLSLVALRNAVYAAPTPDCALETQILLSSVINQGIDTLQAVLNGVYTGDLAAFIIEMNTQFTQVAELQNDLIKRMESQYQTQNAPTPGG